MEFKIELLFLQYNAELLLAEMMSVSQPNAYVSEYKELRRRFDKDVRRYGDRKEFNLVRLLLEKCLLEMQNGFDMNNERFTLLVNLQIQGNQLQTRYQYLVDVHDECLRNRRYYEYQLRLSLGNIRPEINKEIISMEIENLDRFMEHFGTLSTTRASSQGLVPKEPKKSQLIKIFGFIRAYRKTNFKSAYRAFCLHLFFLKKRQIFIWSDD